MLTGLSKHLMVVLSPLMDAITVTVWWDTSCHLHWEPCMPSCQNKVGGETSSTVNGVAVGKK